MKYKKNIILRGIGKILKMGFVDVDSLDEIKELSENHINGYVVGLPNDVYAISSNDSIEIPKFNPKTSYQKRVVKGIENRGVIPVSINSKGESLETLLLKYKDDDSLNSLIKIKYPLEIYYCPNLKIPIISELNTNLILNHLSKEGH